MKKGFTLIELLGVIALLGILALIVYPIASSSLKASRERAYSQIIKSLEESAYNYSIKNDLGNSTERQSLSFAELVDNGYLSNKDLINPIDGNELPGCIIYYWKQDKKQYEFEYSATCS